MGFKFSLLFGVVTCLLSGTGLTGQNPPPAYVNKLQGSSALLQINITSGKTVVKIKLDFHSQSGEKNQIAEISNGTLECTSACGRLGQRLEMVNETTLRINGLEMEDSGVYKAHVRLNGNVYPTYPFYLTVYAPVPKPQISLLEDAQGPEGFNVTLECRVPGGEKVNISWGIGDPTLEGSPDWHRLSANGTVLQVFWKPGSSDSTVTCQASNPVDLKNVSFDLNSILKHEGANPLLYIRLSVAFIVVISIAAIVCWKWKELKAKFQKGFCHRNSTPDATELAEVETLQSAPSQNGYAKSPLLDVPQDSSSGCTPRPPHDHLKTADGSWQTSY